MSTLVFKILHEDHVSYLARTGYIPPALPTDRQCPEAEAARGFSPLAASARVKAPLPAPARDRAASCKASAALAAMRSQRPAPGQAMRPQRRPMPACLFSLKVNKKATLKLPEPRERRFPVPHRVSGRPGFPARGVTATRGDAASPQPHTGPWSSQSCGQYRPDAWHRTVPGMAHGDTAGTRQQVGSCAQKMAEGTRGGHGHISSAISSEHPAAPRRARGRAGQLGDTLPREGRGRARAAPTRPGPGR